MTAYEYLNALRQALEVLPDDERVNAIRYYEEYFLDAGPENEVRVISELGSPEQVAQNILNEYTDLARIAPRPGPGGEGAEEGAPQAGQADGGASARGFRTGAFVPPRRSPAISFLAVCGAIFLAVVFGLPLLAAAVATIVCLAASALVVLVGLAAVLAALLVLLPLTLIASGGVLCVISLFLWGVPASAVLTLGAGLCLLALGGLLAVGCIQLCAVSFRPLLRAAGWCVDQCGRFFRWCIDVVGRFLERLKGV